MTTTHSRADALTDEQRIGLEKAMAWCPHGSSEANTIRELLAASPALQPAAAPIPLKAQLRRVMDLLDTHLGDSDPTLEGMTQEEIEEEFPVVAAMQIIVGLYQDPPTASDTAPSPADERAALSEDRIDWIANAHCPNGTAYPVNVKNAIREALREARIDFDETEAEGAFIDIVFDGPPSRESGRFVEVEDEHGRSFNAGEWIDRGNGLWALRIVRSPAQAPVAWKTTHPAVCVPITEDREIAEQWRAHGYQVIEFFDRPVPAMAAEAVAIPAGWKFVPVDPTPEILMAIWQNERDARRAWERALAAAPQPAQADARVGLTVEQREAVEWVIDLLKHQPQPIDFLKTLAAQRLAAFRALLAAHPGQPEPIAWESTTAVYTKYITDERYQKFSPEVRKWYKPYRCSACTEPRAEVTGWQPIETAPPDTEVVVFWLDPESPEHPERYDFDMLDDGCWRQWTDHYEWAHSVAPAGSRLPREQAPYTHWKPLGSPAPIDAARTGASS